jgi:hypothetical protein
MISPFRTRGMVRHETLCCSVAAMHDRFCFFFFSSSSLSRLIYNQPPFGCDFFFWRSDVSRALAWLMSRSIFRLGTF